MIITAKLFNTYTKPQSRNLLTNLVKLYGQKDINFGDIMAYFFIRFTPFSIHRFLGTNEKIFSTEFGMNRSRVRIISKNFLPSFGQMYSIIKNHSNNERLELYAVLTLYFEQTKILALKPEDVDDCIFNIQLPSWLVQKLHTFANTRIGYKYLFHDDNIRDYEIANMFSVLNNTIKQKSGINTIEYQSLRMKMMSTYGVMFINDKHVYEKQRTKSTIVKKLAKKQKR